MGNRSSKICYEKTKSQIKPKILVKQEETIKQEPVVKKIENPIEVMDINQIYKIRPYFYSTIDQYFYKYNYYRNNYYRNNGYSHNIHNIYNIPYTKDELIKNYKDALSKFIFSEKVELISDNNGEIIIPLNQVITNMQIKNMNDLDLIEKIEISYGEYTIDIIPTNIFTQLQNFYHMKQNEIPFYLLKDGMPLPIDSQLAKLKFHFKINVNLEGKEKNSKKPIAILFDSYKKTMQLKMFKTKMNFEIPMFYIREIEVENDKLINFNSCPCCFIPSEKMDNIDLIINNKYKFHLKYDDKKKWVPMVQNLDSNYYFGYMLNFQRVDTVKLRFDTPKKKIKLFFICLCIFRYSAGFGGYMYKN